MHIEIKTSHDADPLCDPNVRPTAGPGGYDTCENPSDTSTLARGHMIVYVAAQMSRQQRLFLFSLGIFGETARFFRWDRAGVVSSRAFNYKEHPELLAEFFHRFSHLTPEQRGRDPTAVLATEEEEKLLREALRGSFHLHPGMESVFQDSEFPVWKLYVGDGPDQPKRAFIIGSPLFSMVEVTGRCTRGYVALSLDENRLMFLKDTWRQISTSTTPEWETYKLFKGIDGQCVVRNIVPFFCGDDVTGGDGQLQKTVSQEFSEGPHIEPFVHSRMVQDAICRPLRDFKNSKDLVKIIRDAVEGAFLSFLNFAPPKGKLFQQH